MIFEFILKTLLVQGIMSINNLLWINKGGEWYSNAQVENQFGKWKGPVREYKLKDKIKYFFMRFLFGGIDYKRWQV